MEISNFLFLPLPTDLIKEILSYFPPRRPELMKSIRAYDFSLSACHWCTVCGGYDIHDVTDEVGFLLQRLEVTERDFYNIHRVPKEYVTPYVCSECTYISDDHELNYLVNKAMIREQSINNVIKFIVNNAD